jgi:hypothetical protein
VIGFSTPDADLYQAATASALVDVHTWKASQSIRRVADLLRLELRASHNRHSRSDLVRRDTGDGLACLTRGGIGH